MSDPSAATGDELWFRGGSTNAGAISHGQVIHDLGDGIYFSNRTDIAERYAAMRESGSGGQKIFTFIWVRPGELGRVLDLRTDPRWQAYNAENITSLGLSVDKVLRSGEPYFNYFSSFLNHHKINIREYNAVIGPEALRGGWQLAILKHNSTLTERGMALIVRLQPFDPHKPPTVQEIPALAASNAPSLRSGTLVRVSRPPAGSMVRGVVVNQQAMAAFGLALGAGIRSLGDIGIERQIRSRIEGPMMEEIGRIHANGYGCLIVVRVQEWIMPDFNGMRARDLLGVYSQHGLSSAEAIWLWENASKLTAAPLKGWRDMAPTYIWIN
jgi:hypothetical protein